MVLISCLLKLGHWFYVNTRFGRWYFNRSLVQIASSYPLGHSAPITMTYGSYHVRIVSYSKDNYGFIVWRDNSKKCLIVDPGYFPPFHEIIQNEQLILDCVLITHKHYDHCGGISAIIEIYPNIKIVANRKEKITCVNENLDDSVCTITACEEEFLEPIFITAYHTPGHTVGHTVYTINTRSFEYQELHMPLLVFTGDAIFMGSIGAMFECSAKVNLATLKLLMTNLLKLDIASNKIMIFPGHEYSIESMSFLLYSCCPNSLCAKVKLEWCCEQRNWRLPTIPVTLFEEVNYSPYIRVALATKSTEEQMKLLYLTASQNIVTLYIPKLERLIDEILLSEKFVKNQLKTPYANIDEDTLREKLFEDLFNESDKILLKCEHCSRQTHPTNSLEFNLHVSSNN